MSSSDFRVGIVGAGLVGALEACLLAKRGFKVTLFEARHDGRTEQNFYGRSINLAISHRGISALERLGFENVVQECAIPMKARMIHNNNGTLNPIPYDPDGRCINSIERSMLNNFLLNKAQHELGVELKFEHKLVDMNADQGELVFRLVEGRGEDGRVKLSQHLVSYQFDLILACDGARSSVRSLLARQAQMEFSQAFIEHGYLELRIDPNEDGSYQMAPNYLHIWPRGQYMMIALPNTDASFTCTLFMPYSILDRLKDPKEGLRFFESNFPDSIRLIGAERIATTLAQVRPSSLISIKCKPYYYKNKVALLGDAAHAMVPFYGQGMNCGFEDCLVFDELLDEYLTGGGGGDSSNVDKDAIGRVLEEYSRRRCPNGHSMCELAMYNYIEMRDLVNSWSFIMRKHLDNLLYRFFPARWVPLYTMVTFSRTPIHECVKRREEQDKVLAKVFRFGTLPLLLGVITIAWKQNFNGFCGLLRK
uniref:Kynurenine 3-monooxygenase n=1 Tax=Aceria tosichella TaxID=561515 RepID=A0A6G1SIU7_9ACAR